MTVRFLESHRPYVKGDIAGVPDKQAKALIEAGVCEAYKAGKAKDPKKEPETKQVDQAPHDTTCVIELKTKILQALDDEFDLDDRIGFELNLDAAKSVINEDLSELVLN